MAAAVSGADLPRHRVRLLSRQPTWSAMRPRLPPLFVPPTRAAAAASISADAVPFRAIDSVSSIAAARSLIARYYPRQAALFNLSIVAKASPTEADYFTVSSSSSSSSPIAITGTSAVMLTAGFNHYLARVCHVELLTWSSSTPPVLPSPLPAVPGGSMTVSTPYLLRYNYNICTLSYSTQWWNVTQWEREIDWMALRGINAPLALTGEDIVWMDTFIELGLNETEVLLFLAGPAFLAWQRMGNIQGWGGPLTRNWLERQAELQVQLLRRMQSLDMLPVLAGFDGYVPEALKLHFPKAAINASGSWAGFPDAYQFDDFLDPTDPLFQTIGSSFMKHQVARYGATHLYNADSYNEMNPPTSDPTYLAAVSKAVYSAMAAVDPSAVWVMQGWLFVSDPGFWQPAQVEAYLGSVPNDKMIILDLMSDVDPVYPRTNLYYNKSYVWNMLHNFGGNNGMMGMVDVISTVPAIAKQQAGDAQIGIGATPEGIFQNELVYDLLWDMAFRTEPIADIRVWTSDYVRRRYALPATGFDTLYAAYDLLIATVYNCTTGQWGVTKSFVELTPSLQMNNSGFMPSTLWYDNSQLQTAVGLMLQAADDMRGVQAVGRERFEYDVIDFSKQWLSNLLIGYHAQLVGAYNRKDAVALDAAGRTILALVEDWDALLSTNVNYLLGPWIRDARQWGATIDEQDWLEWNARNQITLWGPRGEIADYASKQWGGLLSSYYLPRWQLFVSTLAAAVGDGKQWDEAAFDTAKRAREQLWQHAKEKYPTEPQGNTLQYAQYVVAKYSGGKLL